jgi:hypothetical protein
MLTNGFGMKVARKPCLSAIDLTMYLKKMCLSGVRNAPSIAGLARATLLDTPIGAVLDMMLVELWPANTARS